jgi:hypothetical protein
LRVVDVVLVACRLVSLLVLLVHCLLLVDGMLAADIRNSRRMAILLLSRSLRYYVQILLTVAVLPSCLVVH